MGEQNSTKKQKTRLRGTIKYFNQKKGYGFIKTKAGDDYFFPDSELKFWPKGHAPTPENDAVEFEVAESKKGPIAKKIALLIPAGMSMKKADQIYQKLD